MTGATYGDLCVDVSVDPLGVGQILEHDLAHLKRSLPEAKLEDLDRPDLRARTTKEPRSASALCRGRAGVLPVAPPSRDRSL